eukprot:1944830-Rhodomonas_salina.4
MEYKDKEGAAKAILRCEINGFSYALSPSQENNVTESVTLSCTQRVRDHNVHAGGSLHRSRTR